MTRHLKRIFIVFISSIFCLIFALPVIHAEPADKTILITERANLDVVIANEIIYKDESYLAFETDLLALGGLAAIDAVIADVDALQGDVDTLVDQIQSLIANLVTRQAHVDSYNDLNAAYLQNFTLYTLRSKNLYLDELDRIDVILNNPRSGTAAVVALLNEIEIAHDLLDLLADKTILITALNEANAIAASDGLLYTPLSFAAFLAEHALIATEVIALYGMTADAIAGYSDASVDEANAALDVIQAALDLLNLRPDKTALITNYNLALVHDLSLYTPNSGALFTTGLTDILEVIEDPNALDLDVSQAVLDLEALYDLLVVLADKAALEDVNVLALLAYYEEREFYTTSSYALFKAAVIDYGTYLHVNAVIADANVSQATVDLLTQTILSALELLVEIADVTALQAQYIRLSAIDLTQSTPASIALFEAELNRILLILLSKDTDQALSDQTTLEASVADLILAPLADKTQLKATIERALTFKATDYTLTSYGALNLLLATTEAFIDDLNVNQTEVDALNLKIEEAIDALMMSLDPVVLKAKQGAISINEYVVIGDSQIVSYSSANTAIVTVDATGNVIGHEYGETTVRVTLANGLYEDVPIIVKAKIATSTFVLVITLPFVSAGIAIGLLSTKFKSLNVVRKIRNTKQL